MIFVHDLLLYRGDEEQPALSFNDHVLTYRELAASVLAVARGLQHLGMRRYDRIALYLPKSLETVIGIFAASAAGAVFVPVNPVLKPDKIRERVVLAGIPDSLHRDDLWLARMTEVSMAGYEQHNDQRCLKNLHRYDSN